MVNSKILVIDDDLKILRVIKNILEKNSYVVETRNSVEDINLCDFIRLQWTGKRPVKPADIFAGTM